MRTTLYLLLAVVVMGSCSTYQYVTLQCDKTTRNEQKAFVWENDTVKLIFNFNGKWGSFGLTAMNQTDQPVTINWQKSAIIYKDVPVSLYDGSAVITGNIQRNQLYEKKPAYVTEPALATVNASVSMPDVSTFLPPHSAIQQKVINVSKVVPALIPLPDNANRATLTTDGYTIKYKEASYNASNTPLQFRLFFTYTIGSNNKEFYSEHVFYVSAIKQTSQYGPYQVLINMDGDTFYCTINNN